MAASTSKKIVLNIFAILLFFLAIEGGARLYHFLKYKDPGVFFYGKRFVADVAEAFRRPPADTRQADGRVEVADEVFAGRTMNIAPPRMKEPHTEVAVGHSWYINQFGMRSPHIDLVKPAGTTRIIAVGESFVACVGVADEETWESIAEAQLRQDGYRCEVVNAGFGGHDIHHHLTNLINTYAKLSPDCIILFSAHNDRGALKGEKRYSLGYRLSTFLYNVSQLYAMIREKSSRMLFKDNNYYLYAYDIQLTPAAVDRFLTMYRKRLDEFATVCEERGIRLVFGLQPECIPGGIAGLQQDRDEKKVRALAEKLERRGLLSYYEFEYYLQALSNRTMQEVALRRGLSVFDAITPFPADKGPYFIDEIHLNKNGTKLLADALCAFLVDSGIVKH